MVVEKYQKNVNIKNRDKNTQLSKLELDNFLDGME